MKCNVGGIDRLLRLLIGIIILGLGIYFESFIGLIGLIPIFTAIFRLCPLYLPFKLSTCKTDEK